MLEGCVLCVVLRCAFNLVWVGYFVHLQWATPVDPDRKRQLQSNPEKKSAEDDPFWHSLRSLISCKLKQFLSRMYPPFRPVLMIDDSLSSGKGRW